MIFFIVFFIFFILFFSLPFSFSFYCLSHCLFRYLFFSRLSVGFIVSVAQANCQHFFRLSVDFLIKGKKTGEKGRTAFFT